MSYSVSVCLYNLLNPFSNLGTETPQSLGNMPLIFESVVGIISSIDYHKALRGPAHTFALL